MLQFMMGMSMLAQYVSRICKMESECVDYDADTSFTQLVGVRCETHVMLPVPTAAAHPTSLQYGALSAPDQMRPKVSTTCSMLETSQAE